ncbi:hypothetical protein NW757_003108 [Fusarium falciforme]|nr:hypothetical protein NW757_003108 [Fusarium falciforme]
MYCEGYSANPQISINAAVIASRVIVKLGNLAQKAPGGKYASIHVEEIHAGETGMVRSHSNDQRAIPRRHGRVHQEDG